MRKRIRKMTACILTAFLGLSIMNFPVHAQETQANQQIENYIVSTNEINQKSNEISVGKAALKTIKELDVPLFTPSENIKTLSETTTTVSIGTADELMEFVLGINNQTIEADTNVILISNIDLTGKIWIPINSYKGIFDGQGHVIQNVDCVVDIYGGIFKTNNGTIKNLGVTGELSGGQWIASIAVFNNGIIENCWNGASITVANWTSAGIAVSNSGTIKDCLNYGNIDLPNGADLSTGGIVGSNYGSILNCLNLGTVTGNAGTIYGANSSDLIVNCYYLENTAQRNTGGTAVSAQRLETGEISWLLNESKPDGVWKQTLGQDKFPNFTGKMIVKKGDTFTNSMQIGSADELINFASRVNNGDTNMDGELTQNIDLSNQNWTPIGNDSMQYSGNFYGEGFTININYSGEDIYAGLFGYTNGASISNIGIRGSIVNDAIVESHTGGIVGYAEASKIENSWNGADISSSSNVGGIVGKSKNTNLKSCLNYGDIKSKDITKAGAILGEWEEMDGNSGVDNCYYLDSTLYGSTKGIAKTIADFQSGEVTWLLNGSTHEGVWRQNLGESNYPSFIGEKVYLKDGSYNNSVMISSPDELLEFAQNINNRVLSADTNATLTQDINFANTKWTPIASNGVTYTGTFDGGGYTVNIYYYGGYSGFFQSNNGTIKNLGISGVFNGPRDIGGIASVNYGSIENCWNFAQITIDSYSSAGIVASNHGSVINCYNYGTISSRLDSAYASATGGIVGFLYSGNVENCINYGQIISKAGAIIGDGVENTNNCYYVSGTAYQGRGGTPVNDNELKSGKITWLLNGNKSDGVWKQTINEGNPGFTGKIVYKNGNTFTNLLPISTTTELMDYAIRVNNGETELDAQLIQDIDVADETWIPIGNNQNYFSGIFDGNGFSINMNCISGDVVGIFGNIEGAIIRNLGVRGTLKGENHIGGIAGHVTQNNTIEKCWNSANISTVLGSIGGIIGYISGENNVIKDCWNNGDITGGSQEMGGIVGSKSAQTSSVIKNCFNYGGLKSNGQNNKICPITGNGFIVEEVVNSYFLNMATVQDDALGMAKTFEELKSGEVTWLLNEQKSDGMWRQTLNKDDYPNFVGEFVYLYSDNTYHNTKTENAPKLDLPHVDKAVSTLTLTFQNLDINRYGAIQYQALTGNEVLNDNNWNTLALDNDQKSVIDCLKSGTQYTLYVRYGGKNQYTASEQAMIYETTSPATYTITIPSKTLTAGNSESKNEISATSLDLGYKGQINVKVTDNGKITQDGKLKLVRMQDVDTTIESALLINNVALGNINNNIATFTKSNKTPVSISFAKPTQTNIPAGTYNGTITFAVTYTQ